MTGIRLFKRLYADTVTALSLAVVATGDVIAGQRPTVTVRAVRRVWRERHLQPKEWRA